MKQDSSKEHGFAGSGKHRCTHCGMTTILQTKRRYDGFTLLEEYLACGFCGARIEVVEGSTPQQSAVPTNSASKQSAVSAYLFGTGSNSSSGSDKGGDSTLSTSSRRDARLDDGALGEALGGRFCRDCRYYVKHPFLSRCARHDREVEPMQDCPDFCRPDNPSTKTKPPLTD
ncbi:MAG TPA: hypothetical protein PKY10_08935 [Lentisphaeria bacterium]|nr:hypothetical protein [Lentisphaeria bacterium]